MPIIGGGSGGGGGTTLIYRYTVSGADKASIDTGVDVAQAGSLDWTGGDLLEVFMLIRTDDAAAIHDVDVTVNNDATAIYDRQVLFGNNATVQAVAVNAASAWSLNAHGAGGSASYASVIRIAFPGYAGSTFWKTGENTCAGADQTAANEIALVQALGYRSTSALTRLKVAGQAAAKLKVGSMLAIYKRTS